MKPWKKRERSSKNRKTRAGDSPAMGLWNRSSILWNPFFLSDTTPKIFVAGEDKEEVGEPV